MLYEVITEHKGKTRPSRNYRHGRGHRRHRRYCSNRADSKHPDRYKNVITSYSIHYTKLYDGDAGAATLVSGVESSHETVGPFVYGTDGRGARNLIVPTGGSRTPRKEETSIVREDEHGNLRSEDNLYMNGSEVFTFTLLSVLV